MVLLIPSTILRRVRLKPGNLGGVSSYPSIVSVTECLLEDRLSILIHKIDTGIVALYGIPDLQSLAVWMNLPA